MLAVRVHSVDSHSLLSISSSETTTTTSFTKSSFTETRGVVHLFRPFSRHLSYNNTPQSTHLFIVAVPNYLSSHEFIRFLGSFVDHISQLVIIRNDALEDRYSVSITFLDQLKADELCAKLNGKRFSEAETEVCHILYTLSVDYTEDENSASTPPDGYTELPTCPVCLERLDQDTSGIQSTLCDHSFQCSCISKWTHLSCQVCRLCQQQDEKPTCFDCKTTEDLWVCVICGFVGCGRYKEGHAFGHYKLRQHCYSLRLESQQVWDYVGDTYVHRLNQSKADSKSTSMSYRCALDKGEYGTCGYSEDSGISGVILDSKVEAIMDDYNHLLATQLETQRQHYENLISEAKAKRDSSITEAVEKALTSKTRDIHDRFEKILREKKVVADMNQSLVKSQEVMQKKADEIEEREITSLRSKEEQIVDLEEQIRDLTVYIEAQKTIGTMTGAKEIQGGTVLPVLMKQPSAASTRRQAKSNRRRT